MWRLARRCISTESEIQPLCLELTLPRSKYLSDNELVLVAKELGSLNSQSLKENVPQLTNLRSYFKTLSTRIKKMQTTEINQIMKSVLKNPELRTVDYTSNFWTQATDELASRINEADLDVAVELTHNYCFIKYDGPEVAKLLNGLAEYIQEFEIHEFLDLPFHKLEDLLWSFSFKNLGTPSLYKYIANAMLMHPDFGKATLEQISRIAYYFSRAHLSRRHGGPEFFKKTEEIIWKAIHQGKITKIEQFDDIIHYLIPANIGSNDFRALLEFTLYRLLSDPKQTVTVTQLLKIVTAFTHFVIKYEPLDLLLQQLVKDSLEILNNKQLVQILWSYTRHNKATKDFLNKLIDRLKITLKSEKSLAFRNFTYMINSFVNSGIKDPEVWSHFDGLAINYLKEKNYDDHYLIKFLSLYGGIGWENKELYELGLNELLRDRRLPADHPKDITRAVIATYETPMMQNEKLFEHLDKKVLRAADSMKSDEISKTIYSLALLNKGTPEVYMSLEKNILDSNIDKMKPVNLGIACLGFGLVGMSTFCKRALINVTDCFHRHQGRMYEDYESEDEATPPNKLILIQEKELDFSIHLTATSIVQMAWMAAAAGTRDQMFWSEKLHESLIKIPMANYRYTINEWIWTAKTIQDEFDIVTALDPFHYGLLQQILALIPPKGIQYDEYFEDLEKKVLSYPQELIDKMEKPHLVNYEFLQSVKDTAAGMGLDINGTKRHTLGMKLELNINGREILLYDKDDYIYLSKGYSALKGTKDLLTHLKLKKQILRASGKKAFEIPIGDWTNLTQEEKKLYLAPLSKTN